MASDAPTVTTDRAGGSVAPDHVIGVGASSVLLARMTVRRPIGRALDLGTGGGVQALNVSSHAGEVVATDLNRRALGFARFSMGLSRVANVTTRESDLFSAVRGERFDLIVSNPPYVISPESRLVFRDGGLEADGLCRRLVRDAARPSRGGRLLSAARQLGPPNRGQLEGPSGGVVRGLRVRYAWVIQRSVDDVEEYAVGWVLHGEPGGGGGAAAEARVLDEWLAYYARLGIDRIGFGLITLRRRESGRPFVRFEELPHDPGIACGDDIARSFQLRDWLDSLDGDDGLLDVCLAVAPDVHLHRDLVASGGAFVAGAGELRRSTGLRREGLVDDDTIPVVGGCDGTSTLRSLLRDLASELGARPMRSPASPSLS